MYVSAIALGNWATHGETMDQDVATSCVRKALDLGITTSYTADAYAGTKAETMLGEALKGVRREGIEVMTKAYFPTGAGRNDRGLSRKHVMVSISGMLQLAFVCSLHRSEQGGCVVVCGFEDPCWPPHKSAEQ